MEHLHAPVTVPDTDAGSQTGRWLICASVGGAVLLAVHLLVRWGKLEPGYVLALAVLAPGILLGLINGLLEWKYSSLLRALDEVIVAGAVVMYSAPSMVALVRGDTGSFGPAVMGPMGVLVVVWAVRGVESLAGSALDRHPDLPPVHAPGALASLVSLPGAFGRSRGGRLARRIGIVLTVGALPAGVLVIVLGWLLTGRVGMPSYFTLAAAVSLSLAPRLVRNVLPPVIAAGLLEGRASGCVFRDDREFEKAGQVDAMVLRKRGVLVESGCNVIEFHHLGQMPRETVLALVASCEEVASESEPGEALIRFARREGVKPGDTRLTRWFASRGVQSTSPFGELFVGNRLFLIENGISVGRGETVAQEAEKRGHTAVFVSVDRNIEAVAVLENKLRPTARAAVDRCRKLGVASVLISGDSFRTAEAIGHSLGVDQIRPEVAVGSREQEVSRLRSTGYCLALLGNLRTGLESSANPKDVHMGLQWDGEQVAEVGWSATVTGDDLVRAVDSLDLARRSRRLMIANWALALVGGGLGFGFAASGLAGPIVAALVANLVAAVMMAVRPRIDGARA